MKKLLYILLFVPLTFLGQENYSLSFDGINDNVIIPERPEYEGGEHSVMIWVNHSSRGDVVSKDNEGSNERQWLLEIGSDNKVVAHVWNNNNELYQATSNQSILKNQWNHIAQTWDGDTLSVYINGEIDTTILTDNSILKEANCPVRIGGGAANNSPGYYLTANLDDAQIWNIKLSQDEIKSYMSCSPSGDEVGLVGYWNFNQNDNPDNYVDDLSYYANHGEINGPNYSEDVPENNCIEGCTDDNSFNYNPLANFDDGNCQYAGCKNPEAINYDENALEEDEHLCVYSQEYVHGLWNEVDDGAIEYENLQEESLLTISSLQQALDTWNTTIDLSAGWNMFGYGCPSSIDVAEGLSNHTESIIITKDNNGNVYMPEFGFNGIGNFTPGFGYQIKLTEAIEGFSLCDWYVNDIPEDNIVSLQEDNASLQEEVDFMSPYFGCIDESACNYDETILLSDGSCEYAELGFHCDGSQIQIGDFYGGGIIFYLDETGQHGLVVAMEDLTEGATDHGWGFNGYEWGCYGQGVNGADGTSIGTGYQNTIDIVNQGCSTNNGGITAAQAALDAQINGYSDWYLPSFDELFEMYNTIGIGGPEGYIGGFETSNGPYYWSSSEDDSDGAWGVNFSNGGAHHRAKASTGRVRVIRAF